MKTEKPGKKFQAFPLVTRNAVTAVSGIHAEAAGVCTWPARRPSGLRSPDTRLAVGSWERRQRRTRRNPCLLCPMLLSGFYVAVSGWEPLQG